MCSTLLHTICTRELVMLVKKPDSPSVIMRRRRSHRGRRWHRCKGSSDFFPVRKLSTHTAEQAWAMMVAMAAPFTPRFSP